MMHTESLLDLGAGIQWALSVRPSVCLTDLKTTFKLGLVGTRSPHFVSEILYIGCGYLALKLSPPTLKTKSALLNDKIESWLLLLQHLSHVTIVTY